MMNKLRLLSVGLLAIAQITFGYTVTVVNKWSNPITAASCKEYDEYDWRTDKSDCLPEIRIEVNQSGAINIPDGIPTNFIKIRRTTTSVGVKNVFFKTSQLSAAQKQYSDQTWTVSGLTYETVIPVVQPMTFNFKYDTMPKGSMPWSIVTYYSPLVDQFKKVLAEKNKVTAELIKIFDRNNKELKDQDRLDSNGYMKVILPENRAGSWWPKAEDIDKLISTDILKDLSKK